MNRRFNGNRGTALLEFTIVFPLLVLLTFGLIDLSLVILTVAEANRATQVGSRHAVTHPPVADGLGGTIAGTVIGTPCINADGTSSHACVIPAEYTCTVSNDHSASCTSAAQTLGFNRTSFNEIRDKMAGQFLTRRLDERSIVIKYTPLELGFVGRPYTAMQVTVSLRCLDQPLFFVGGVLTWAMPAVSSECRGIASPGGFPLPSFSTTLFGEDFADLEGDAF